eukprot:4198283-Amphidinium_carterae.1
MQTLRVDGQGRMTLVGIRAGHLRFNIMAVYCPVHDVEGTEQLLQEAIATMREFPEPTLLMGDFNHDDTLFAVRE